MMQNKISEEPQSAWKNSMQHINVSTNCADSNGTRECEEPTSISAETIKQVQHLLTID